MITINKNPAEVIPDISENDIIIVVLYHGKTHPNFGYMGYIQKQADYCSVLGLPATHLTLPGRETTPFNWTLEIRYLNSESRITDVKSMKASIMTTIIKLYNMYSSLRPINFHAIKNGTDLYELIEMYSLKNIKFINGIEMMLNENISRR